MNRVKKHISKLIILSLLSVFVVLSFTGCGNKDYSGEYPELYTVATNSVLWNNGHSYGADRVKDSQIEIIEKDDYGRTLFTYYEAYYAGAKLSFSALLIAQHSSDDYVYYYEDYNYVIKKQESYSSDILDFTQEEINKLKSYNDWNCGVNFEKCVKKQISNVKQEIPYDRQTINEKAVENFKLANKGYNLFLNYLTGDNNGNFIVYGSIIKLNGEEDIYFAALINSTSEEIKFFVPNNTFDYRQEFIKFKAENGWIN